MNSARMGNAPCPYAQNSFDNYSSPGAAAPLPQSQMPGGISPIATTPDNYTTGDFGQQLPFPDSQLSGMSGMQMAPVPQSVPPVEIPETLASPIFTPGFLRKQIGKWMRVEFLLANSLNDRVGKLIEVGASYILLQSLEPGSLIMCDLFSIKFVTIISDRDTARFYGIPPSIMYDL